MIVIVESNSEVRSGTVEVIIRYGPDGVSSANGRVLAPATREEYIAHLLQEQGFPAVAEGHGPFYYKVAVD